MFHLFHAYNMMKPRIFSVIVTRNIFVISRVQATWQVQMCVFLMIFGAMVAARYVIWGNYSMVLLYPSHTILAFLVKC